MKTIPITLDNNLHRAPNTKATELGMTLGDLVREAIAEQVAMTKQKNRAAQ